MGACRCFVVFFKVYTPLRLLVGVQNVESEAGS